MTYPLAGVKVLDFTRVLAGPFVSRMLSDLGADVVKVEPPEGDMTRGIGRKINDLSGYFTQQNAGKRAICVDLARPGAAELMLQLAAEADIVLENFRPGIMAGFGLGWEHLSAVNPQLVMLSISGFGQTGPERDRAELRADHPRRDRPAGAPAVRRPAPTPPRTSPSPSPTPTPGCTDWSARWPRSATPSAPASASTSTWR